MRKCETFKMNSTLINVNIVCVHSDDVSIVFSSFVESTRMLFFCIDFYWSSAFTNQFIYTHTNTYTHVKIQNKNEIIHKIEICSHYSIAVVILASFINGAKCIQEQNKMCIQHNQTNVDGKKEYWSILDERNVAILKINNWFFTTYIKDP